MATDTSERGLERLICAALTGKPCDPPKPGQVAEPAPPYGGKGWICGNPQDYDREYCIDLTQLSAFLKETQPEAADSLELGEDNPTRRKFLARLQGKISKQKIEYEQTTTPKTNQSWQRISNNSNGKSQNRINLHQRTHRH